MYDESVNLDVEIRFFYLKMDAMFCLQKIDDKRC